MYTYVDLMYCTPSLALNRWLQMIQKYTGIQNKPVAALLTIFIAIMTLLITVVIPAVSVSLSVTLVNAFL